MSYITPFLPGFFDHAAAARGELKLRKTIDVDMAARLLAEAADRRERAFHYIGPDRFTVQDGYVQCWGAPHRPGAAFMIRFTRAMDCEIYDWGALVVQSATAFAKSFNGVEQMRADRRERARRTREERKLRLHLR